MLGYEAYMYLYCFLVAMHTYSMYNNMHDVHIILCLHSDQVTIAIAILLMSNVFVSEGGLCICGSC